MRILTVLFVLVAALCVQAEKSKHTNNWAVIVDTSRNWLNYRHVANALSFYHMCKRFGMRDDQIVLMLADDVPCDARNYVPSAVFNKHDHHLDLYGGDVQVDYKGYEVTVKSLLQVLQGRHTADEPPHRRLQSNAESNVLVYLNGHGGDQFLKFQDSEELTSQDVADAFRQMWEFGQYKNLLFIAETCQAESMCDAIDSPNVVCIGSSKTGQDSYAHHNDEVLGLPVMDRLTAVAVDYVERLVDRGGPSADAPLESGMFAEFTHSRLLSDAVWREAKPSEMETRLGEFMVRDFLGGRTPHWFSNLSSPVVGKLISHKRVDGSKNKQDKGTAVVGSSFPSVRCLLVTPMGAVGVVAALVLTLLILTE